jgi:hypothetical protein
MAHRYTRRILTLCAFTLISATIALAQSPASPETAELPIGNTTSDTWQSAQQAGSSKDTLIIVTLDQPNRRQTCHLRSYTADELVCSRAIGGPRTYFRQQVVALILPGEGGLRLVGVLGLYAEAGAAIWGTVVLAATCPACAVATGFVAFGCFIGAQFIQAADDLRPDRLLYLAPGQQLSPKLGHVHR